MINNDETIWGYVVPGLHLEFVKDLMDDETLPYYVLNPTSVNYDISLPKNHRPEFEKGEEAYGFVGSQDESPVVRWAIARDAVVCHSSIMPFDR